MPLLSISTTIYNRPEVIKMGLDSLFSQGLDESDVEIIAVNNGSTNPEVKKILDTYTYNGKRPKNFRVIEVKENRMTGSGRNAGMRAATGEYIMNKDNDDTFSEGELIKVYKHLKKHPELDVLMCDHVTFDFNTKKVIAPMKFTSNSSDIMTGEEYLSTQNVPYMLSHCAVRKNLITDNDIFVYENVKIEDSDWILRVILHAGKIQYLPIPILKYHRYGTGKQESGTYRTYPLMEGVFNILDRIYKESFKVENKFPKGAKFFRFYYQHHYAHYAKFCLWRLPRKDIVKILNDYPRHAVSDNDAYQFVNKHPKLYVLGATILGPILGPVLDAYRKFRHAEPI